ncbi:TPA: ERF family protein [Clostridioides difficile]|uniref:ERF family protein n=1 Tax=Clostridioides difficile TaxID=1496 RepID=UPI001025DF13|nr:ERF family protein [Clostridioides difficile]VFH03787.1 essential recombination function protein [Clostridioides difficile]VIB68778.1 essential recombination function protein [Clostridioides difficile]VII19189.1 essential recombination function protein [Clostridioides difficile]VII46519.1 essential recombination function protein [Clostridioides difficile]VII54515.1 essential recombination function protein [Clostridioides difficile]
METNIYIKLMDVRVKFSKLNLKKSGENKFANFKYFELADFLPQATGLLEEVKLCPIVTFTNDYATLTLINGENPTEQITFTSPMRDLQLKGSNELQALGGIETYQTRYLYIQLLNITENDSFDAVSGKNEAKNNVQQDKNTDRILTDKQLTRLYAIANSAGVNKTLLKEQVFKQLGKDIKDLNKSEYDAVCTAYEKQAFKGA